ncbi:MAG: MFS transporter [Anaerolineaceae bacterium]|nr:MFS transporter [Anaerolineaceae bacterium]
MKGAVYYAAFYAVVGSYFAYINVAYIQRGLSGVQIGTFSSVGAFLALVASPLLTGLADRKGWHKQILVINNLVFGIALVALFFIPTFRWMLPVVALNAVAGAPLMPISDSLLVRMANKYHLDFGQMRLWGSIGFTVVCILTGTLWDAIGLEYLFIISGILFGLRSLSVLLLEAPDRMLNEVETNTGNSSGLKSYLLPFKDRPFVLFLIGTFFWGCCISFFIYSSIYMDQLGGNSLLVGLMMAIPALMEVPTLLVADRLADRFGLLPVFMAGILQFCLIIVAVIFVKSPTVLVILNGVRGLGFGLNIVMGIRYVDRLAPKEQTGLYQSLYNVVLFTVSMLIFMPFLGYLFDFHGIQWAFIATALAGGVAILIFGVLHFLTKHEVKTSQMDS